MHTHCPCSLEQLQQLERGQRLTLVYDSLRVQRNDVRWETLVWSRMHIPKTSFVSWLVCHSKLATTDRVARFCDIADSTCVLCGEAAETQEHLFFHCSYAFAVLQKTLHSVGLEAGLRSLEEWITCFHQAWNQGSLLLQLRAAAMCCTIYCLWQVRNEIIFTHKSVSSDTCSFRIHCMLANKWRYIGVKRS